MLIDFTNEALTERMEQRALEAFNKEFNQRLKGARTHRDVFEEVTTHFEERAGFTIYSSFESYKNAKSKHRKRSRRF